MRWKDLQRCWRSTEARPDCRRVIRLPAAGGWGSGPFRRPYAGNAGSAVRIGRRIFGVGRFRRPLDSCDLDESLSPGAAARERALSGARAPASGRRVDLPGFSEGRCSRGCAVPALRLPDSRRFGDACAGAEDHVRPGRKREIGLPVFRGGGVSGFGSGGRWRVISAVIFCMRRSCCGTIRGSGSGGSSRGRIAAGRCWPASARGSSSVPTAASSVRRAARSSGSSR